MLKHLWFDFAGTLYRETPEFNAAHDNFRFQVYANLKGLTDLEAAKREFLELYRKHGSNSAVFRSLGQPSDYWMKALDSFDFISLLKPDPIISATLRRLKGMLPISLFTNLMPSQINMLLQHIEIPKDYFTHILSGDHIAERKPALDGFHKMIELSGVPAEQIMYVGDRVDVDIRPAKQVGMKACLIYGKSNEADYCTTSPTELMEIVGGII